MSFIVPIGVQLFILGNHPLDAWILGFTMVAASAIHNTVFVNSAAHMFGDRPYNNDIEPQENYYVSLGSWGEGFHNYHHVFPWDYKAGEYSSGFNLATYFIDLMYYCGQAYNLRTASDNIVNKTKAKTAEKEKRFHQRKMEQPAECFAPAADGAISVVDESVILSHVLS
jgi:stearoyl-CoA desaturase (delta-9 desaturase)